ncbi:hypothetical protein JTE90_005321 [Oedothorax gibbosus]|uniref:Uncharacterized protein n=1 Tax=Oedothorax gibbosus TaxID=931172 RepID=A0AAV6UIA5_9ARAC|nr:hypothetical protein JTE90_005321 [Oedothorax gibbosus]
MDKATQIPEVFDVDEDDEMFPIFQSLLTDKPMVQVVPDSEIDSGPYCEMVPAPQQELTSERIIDPSSELQL